jgi:murein hydrolase activator
MLPCLRSVLFGLVLLLPAAVHGADLRALGVAQERGRDEYAAVASRIALSQERTATLAAEVATVRKDRETLDRALLASAGKEKALAAEIDAILVRMQPLKAAEERVKLSLIERRDVLAEVLGALQRMGLNPPPALLVEPEDALASVRSAILLGAVVPSLRAETDKLAADLAEARRLAAAIEAERDSLGAAAEAQAAERRRLGMLIGEKQRLAERTEADLLAERWHAAELAARAGSLKDLIARSEREAEALDRERRAAEEKRRRDVKLASLPIPEANRLVLSDLFGSLRGRLALPAQGQISRRFGEADGNGAAAQGDTLATQSGAIVYAPADAGVLYAGPFRSYGQLLILDAGDGYHMVLAGMDRIDVGAGQSVLAGEPVGGMGSAETGTAAAEARVAGAAPVIGQGEDPQLYIEFRKDGQPVDPAPWWAKSSGRKRNGT